MPDQKRHNIQASHNEDLLKLLSDKNAVKIYSDWYVTIAFYACVHHFEAFLAQYNKNLRVGKMGIRVQDSDSLCEFFNTHSAHHARKKIMLENLNIFQEIYNPYQDLYEMSRIARYNCHATDEHNYGFAEHYLNQVKEGFSRLMTTRTPKK